MQSANLLNYLILWIIEYYAVATTSSRHFRSFSLKFLEVWRFIPIFAIG